MSDDKGGLTFKQATNKRTRHRFVPLKDSRDVVSMLNNVYPLTKMTDAEIANC